MKKIALLWSFLFLASISPALSQDIDSVLIVSQRAFSTVPDTTVHQKLTKSLRGFLKEKNKGSGNNPYIDPLYLKKNREPFSSIVDIEQKMPNGQYYFKPTMLHVLPIDDSSFLIKLAYMAVSLRTKDLPYLKMIATLVAKKNNDGYFFYTALEYNTRLWNKKTIGNIHYISSNAINSKKGHEMDIFNTKQLRALST